MVDVYPVKNWDDIKLDKFQALNKAKNSKGQFGNICFVCTVISILIPFCSSRHNFFKNKCENTNVTSSNCIKF